MIILDFVVNNLEINDITIDEAFMILFEEYNNDDGSLKIFNNYNNILLNYVIKKNNKSLDRIICHHFQTDIKFYNNVIFVKEICYCCLNNISYLR